MGIKKFDLTIPRMGYVLAYKTDGSWYNGLIMKKQFQAGFSMEDSQITHVEISGGGKHSINIAPPLVKAVDITKKHTGRHVTILRYKNKDYEERGRYKIAYLSAAICLNKGRLYDIFGILAFLYKWMKQTNRLLFCSEGCLMAFQMVYPAILNSLKPADCMPAHFLSKEFEKVWEGTIP